MPVFYVDLHGPAALTVDEVWPDGDAPENPTPADVVAAMRRSAGSAHATVDQWNLLDSIEVSSSAPDPAATFR
jgi:hypothetical protein